MITLAIGRRERGKTTLVYWLARQVPQRIIFDPRRQFDRAVTLRASTPDEIEAVIEQLYADPVCDEAIVTPIGDVQPAFDALIDGVRRWIDAGSARPLAIVIDEARFVDLTTPDFQWILRCAPRQQVHLLVTSHRPKDDEIPVSVQSIADRWCLFHTTQPHDLKIIRERAGDVVAAQVTTLNAYEWILWDDGTGEFTVHTDAAVWFVPIRARDVPVLAPAGSDVPRGTRSRMTREKGLFDA